MTSIVVGSAADLGEGQMRAVEHDGESVAVVRVAGRVCAIKNRCTHEAWSLADGYVIDGRVVCSLHGAAFDPVTGACVRGPAEDAVETFPAEVRGSDIVVIVSKEKP